MADLEQTFSDATDEAAASLTAALNRISAPGEPSAPKGEEPGSPVGAEGTTPSESEQPEGSDDPEGEDDDEGKPKADEDGDDDFDPAKTLAKYKTPEDRDRAIIESQRTLLRERREAEEREAALKAEVESLKAGKTQDPPKDKEEAAPKGDDSKGQKPGESYDAWMDRISLVQDPATLNEDDRQVFTRLSSLKEEKRAVAALEEKRSQLVTKEAECKAEQGRLQILIDEHTKAVAEDDLDEGARNRLARYKAQLEDSRNTLRDLKSDKQELVQEIFTKTQRLDRSIVALDEDARAFHSEIRTVDERKSKAKGLQDTWQKGLTAAFSTHDAAMSARKERKFDEDERTVITLQFERALNDYIRDNGHAPEDLERWIGEQKTPFERAVRIRKSSGATVASRAAGLEPGAPGDSKAGRGKTPPRSEKPRSFVDEHEAAGEKLERLLRAG